MLLEQGEGQGAIHTALERYEAGSVFAIGNSARGEELFVLQGDLCFDDNEHGAGTYIRRAESSSKNVFTKSGCMLFVKRNHFRVSKPENVIVDTTVASWHPGHGKLEVMPLVSGIEGSTLVKWPANEVFVPHKHEGGEEILVLLSLIHISEPTRPY